jgi:hypothetical protein
VGLALEGEGRAQDNGGLGCIVCCIEGGCEVVLGRDGGSGDGTLLPLGLLAVSAVTTVVVG